MLTGKIHQEGQITEAPSLGARALHLTFWSLVAHSSSSAGSNRMMLSCAGVLQGGQVLSSALLSPCPPPPQLSVASNAPAP